MDPTYHEEDTFEENIIRLYKETFGDMLVKYLEGTFERVVNEANSDVGAGYVLGVSSAYMLATGKDFPQKVLDALNELLYAIEKRDEDEDEYDE